MPQAEAEGLDIEEVQDDEPQEGEIEASEEHAETDEESTQTDGEGSETDEVQVSIGDEPATAEEDDEKAPAWVRELRADQRELRRTNREKDQRIRELEQAQAPAAVAVGVKPTLDSCEFDTERFERELTSWHDRKREADGRAAEEQRKAEAAKSAWQGTVKAYEVAKAALKVRDADDAEAAAKDVLSTTQQGLILQGAENPALVVYAIGKNPVTAKRLAGIEDPVKFAFAVAKLEKDLKVTPKKTAPVPERVIRGSAGTSGRTDATLEKLEAQAERSGDRSKVIAYKRQQRERSTTS